MIEFGVFFSIAIIVMGTIYAITQMDAFNPFTLFAVPYGLCYLVYYKIYSNHYKLTNKTVLLYVVGITLFLLAFLLAVNTFKNHRMSIRSSGNDLFERPVVVVQPGMLKLYIFIGIIGFLIGAYQTFKVGISGPVSFFSNIRINEIQGSGRNFFVKYSSVFLYVATITDIYNVKSDHRKLSLREYALMGFLLLSVLFTLARTELLTYALSLAYMFFVNTYQTRERRSFFAFLKKYFPLLLMIIAFIAMFLIIGNNSGRQFGTQLSDENFVLWGYSGHGFVNFDRYAVRGGFIQDWYALFTPIESILKKVFGAAGRENLGMYINNNFSTFNTFTSFGFMYMCAGTIGLVFVNLIYGWFCGWLYMRAKGYGGLYEIFYSSYIYTLVISFFAYQIMNTSYIYVIVLLLIVTKINLVFGRQSFRVGI